METPTAKVNLSTRVDSVEELIKGPLRNLHVFPSPPSPTLYISNIANIPASATRYATESLEAVLRQQEGVLPPMRTAKGGAISFADFGAVQKIPESTKDGNKCHAS